MERSLPLRIACLVADVAQIIPAFFEGVQKADGLTASFHVVAEVFLYCISTPSIVQRIFLRGAEFMIT